LTSTDTAGSVGAVEVRQDVEWIVELVGLKGPAGISYVSLSKEGTKHVYLHTLNCLGSEMVIPWGYARTKGPKA